MWLKAPLARPTTRWYAKDSGELGMRLIRAAAMIALLLTVPAYAQKMQAAPTTIPKSPQEIEAEKAAERAYKNSLHSIPDKPAADPWGGTRSMEAPKPDAKAPPKKTKTSGSTN
jgi:hypothetical protein